MCSLFIVYYKFFIFHSAKAYLGPFQASMMDFFSAKSTVYRLQLHRHDDLKGSFYNPRMWRAL